MDENVKILGFLIEKTSRYYIYISTVDFIISIFLFILSY